MGSSLGDVLVEQGVIDAAVLSGAVERQRAQGMSLARVLVAMGAASETQIVAAVARQIGLPFADCSPGAVDPQAAGLLSRDVARELCALPVRFSADDELLVAVADPSAAGVLPRVEALTGLRVVPGLAVRRDLEQAIEHIADPDGGAATRPAAAAQGAPAASSKPAEPTATSADGPSAGDGLLMFERALTLDLDAALIALLEAGGSDLHLTAGVPPTIRINGELRPLPDFPVLAPDDIRQAVYGILNQRQREVFENVLELDLAYAIPRRARFRVNVFQQRDAVGAVMRTIPFDIKSIEDLGVPAQVGRFAELHRGFVLVTGPTGSGKSTTLAAIIDRINRDRSAHVMTVEDPIEFLHRHKRSVVNQREVGSDTRSFANALKHALRQDPDVILVGELRDLETIQVALTAAETGHLVFGTLHTQDAPQTIDRLIDVFPPHQQEQIRVMLSGALQGVVCQQLVKTSDGRGRIAACELLIATSAIRNLIREGKTHQMYSALQAGKEHGMVTMDQSLAALVLTGRVTYETALSRCNHPTEFDRLCGRA